MRKRRLASTTRARAEISATAGDAGHNDARSALSLQTRRAIKSAPAPKVVAALTDGGQPRLGISVIALPVVLVNTPFIALPNILAGQALVPELIQTQPLATIASSAR